MKLDATADVRSEDRMADRQAPVRTARGIEHSHTPFPHPDLQTYEILRGDARDLIASLDEVHCVVTSPPYWHMKRYGQCEEEVGTERDADEYVETLCELFEGIPLHERGSIWINLRDKRRSGALMSIPERLTIAMQDLGWRFVDRVVWAKSALLPDGTVSGNHMPEPAKGRLNGNGWEHLLRFTKSSSPWADDCAAKVPRANGEGARYLPEDRMDLITALDGRTPADMWLLGPDRSGAAHVAPWPSILCEIPIALTCPLWVNPDGSLPERLIEMAPYDDGRGSRSMGKYTQMELIEEDGPARNDTGDEYVPRKPEVQGWTDIMAGARPGIVLDPFCGSGTTGEVAIKLGRSFAGLELYEEHCRLAEERVGRVLKGLRDQALISNKHSAQPDRVLPQQAVSGVKT